MKFKKNAIILLRSHTDKGIPRDITMREFKVLQVKDETLICNGVHDEYQFQTFKINKNQVETVFQDQTKWTRLSDIKA